MWAQTRPTAVLFHESFGNNSESARAWDDSYSVKSGVSAVYSGITSYTVSNAKQGKNTTGSTQSGLNQSTSGTDASIVIGPLKVSDYNTLKVTYQWKAASIKKTYTTSLYYKTSSTGEFTEVSGTGTGATTFVERSYSLPVAAQVSTLYLKIVWNTSNTQGIIDEVELTGVASAKITDAKYATYVNTTAPLDFSGTGITVYTATDNETSVSLNEVTSGQIPANTPVVLYKDDANGTAIDIPVITGAAPSAPAGTNDLKVSTGTDVENMYVLAKNPTIGFYPWTGTNLSAGKIYLQGKDSYGSRNFLGFEEGTTTVNIVKTQMVDGQYFNLAGQRVSNPTKGFYIVNGKKVIIK